MMGLYSAISSQETAHPEMAFITTGDFNKGNLEKVLPKLHQHIYFNTRGERLLDHCYTSFRHAYKALLRAPFSQSGCVLSPLLYSHYTYDCTATSNSNIIVKFVDDTTVVAYREEISARAHWCQKNHLTLNITKTKGLIVDFRRCREAHTPITINGAAVERVSSLRFLDVYLVEDLTWSFIYNEKDQECWTAAANSKTHSVFRRSSTALYERNAYLLECVNGIGTDYRGTKSRTNSGKICQRWDSSYPHRPNFTPQSHPQADLHSNFCRNPDGDSNGPWCYTTDPNARWEHCNVPSCSG